MDPNSGAEGNYTVVIESSSRDPDVEVGTVLANKQNLNVVESPDHIRADQRIGGSDSGTMSPDLMYSNPTLVTNGDHNSKLRLVWENLCVDAELPPPSCFQRMKACCTGNSENIQEKSIRPVLKNVTGVAEPGSLLAIMGASGAGKTTLLNVLSRQNIARLNLRGNVMVNNQVIKNKIKSISAYVQQEDLFIGTLTVKEHLTFQALLRLDDSYSMNQKKQRVTEVLQQLGLMKCKDSIIGVPGRIRGISGGENKRLSFASEIITNPKLLFVDEPTSGLDSFMAESVISALQKIASEGRTILATIHQPSSATFNLFDRLLLLSEGRTAFLGTTKQAISFFNKVDYPCPVNYNPADHYVHTLAIIPGNEEECKAKAMAICDAFAEQSERKESITPSTSGQDNDEVYTKQSYKVGFGKQLTSVLWRSWKANQREPFVSTLRIAQAIVIALIAGLVYLDQDLNQAGVTNMNGAMFFCITTLSFNSITGSLFVFPAELPVFLKEHKLGMYRTDVYFICKTLAELPWYILSSFLFATIVYFMTDFGVDAAKFFVFAGILQLITQCSLSFGYFVSAIAPTVQVATSIGPPLMMPFLLFGGFFVKDESIPDYFIWLKFLSWFKYAFECLQINQWDDIDSISCEFKGNKTICLTTGANVLARNGYEPDNMWPNVGILFALLIGFRIIAFLFVLLRAYRAK